MTRAWKRCGRRSRRKRAFLGGWVGGWVFRVSFFFWGGGKGSWLLFGELGGGGCLDLNREEPVSRNVLSLCVFCQVMKGGLRFVGIMAKTAC